jgi:hypothetical protein
MKLYLVLLLVLVSTQAFAQFGGLKEQTERAMKEQESREANRARMERLQGVVPAEGQWVQCDRQDIKGISRTLVFHGNSRSVWHYYGQGTPLGYVAPTQLKGSGFKATLVWDESHNGYEFHFDTFLLYNRIGARGGVPPWKCQPIERLF